MARELKTIISSELEKRLSDLDGCVLVDYRGLNAEQTLDLRSSLRKDGVRMSVVQNRLARRVLGEQGVPDGFQVLFRGPTAILRGGDGALAASKAIVQWRKKNEDRVQIKGGLFQGRAMDVAGVERLAAIPDPETLRGRLMALFLAPAAFLATAAQSLLSHFAGASMARREDLEKGSAGADS